MMFRVGCELKLEDFIRIGFIIDLGVFKAGNYNIGWLHEEEEAKIWLPQKRKEEISAPICNGEKYTLVWLI